MGKLSRIRLLRPDDVHRGQEGISEKELAVLLGNMASRISLEMPQVSAARKKERKKEKECSSRKSSAG